MKIFVNSILGAKMFGASYRIRTGVSCLASKRLISLDQRCVKVY